MIPLWEEFVVNTRIADAIDIAIVAVLLYWILVCLKKTLSRAAVGGGILLLALYVVAQSFDLTLTTLVFQIGFVVLMVALVVVFQEDLRRFFEAIVTRDHFRGVVSLSETSLDIEILVGAVFTLAARKTGALIALTGREPINRHIEGGIALNGNLSRPLFYSLFDPNSPGHDGAVIIKDNRIARFAAHLPLSSNRSQIGTHGTRHSAAIGLAERSDALVVVVSEERGTVSIAEAGQVSEIESPAELKDTLEKFMDSRFPATPQKAWKRSFTRNIPYKLLAVLLAALGWLIFARPADTVQRTFAVPIEYRNVPPELELSGTTPTEAQMTLSGSESSFMLLDPSELRVTVDLKDASPGYQAIHLDADNLQHPSNLEVFRIEPRVIWLDLRR